MEDGLLEREPVLREDGGCRVDPAGWSFCQGYSLRIRPGHGRITQRTFPLRPEAATEMCESPAQQSDHRWG